MCVCLCGEGGARLSRRNAQTQVCSALATPMSLAQFSIEIWFELRVPFVKEKKKTRPGMSSFCEGLQLGALGNVYCFCGVASYERTKTIY